jgi:LmbE family N-acetylglucosaminyl deacetylase
VIKLQKLNPPVTKNKVALVCIAHADDLLLFCGATVLNLISQGWQVHVVRVTDDRWDSWGLDTSESISRNQSEFNNAMKKIGVNSIIELGYATDVLGDNSEVELRGHFIDAIRHLKPYLIMSFDPDSYLHEDNEDHRLVARAMAEASWTSGFDKHPGANGRVGTPHLPIEKWYFGRKVAEVTHYQMIEPFKDRLVSAVSEHKTMLQNMAQQLSLKANFLGYSLDRLLQLVDDSPAEFAKLILAERSQEELRIIDSENVFHVIERFGDRL